MNPFLAPIPNFCLFSKVLGLLEGKTVADIREQLDQDYKSTMLANWGVFVPAAVVNLAFCPPELRVLFLNVSASVNGGGWFRRKCYVPLRRTLLVFSMFLVSCGTASFVGPSRAMGTFSV